VFGVYVSVLLRMSCVLVVYDRFTGWFECYAFYPC